MTVGIVLLGKGNAVALADARVSGLGRQSDSFDKVTKVRGSSYHGIIFGTGSGNFVLGVKEAAVLGDTSLEVYVSSLHQQLKSLVTQTERSWLQEKAEESQMKALAFTDEAQRAQFLQAQPGIILQQYDQAKRDNQTYLVTAGIDKATGRPRAFHIGETGTEEIFLPHFEIGSGADGAGMYLATALQGVDVKTLSIPELAFFAMNAFSTATVNVGVGGVPKLAVMSGDKPVCIVDEARTIALANLSGAHLARHRFVADVERVIGYFNEVLDGTDPRLDILAQAIEMDQKTLTEKLVPYSMWQNKVNKTIFGSKANGSPKQ